MRLRVASEQAFEGLQLEMAKGLGSGFFLRHFILSGHVY